MEKTAKPALELDRIQAFGQPSFSHFPFCAKHLVFHCWSCFISFLPEGRNAGANGNFKAKCSLRST